jgi:1-hydroxy-2-naphthoate dioxygenase
VSVSTTIEEFDVELAQRHMRGAWTYENPADAVVGKVPLGVPAIWRWKEVHDKLLQACEIFPDVLTARRGIEFINPALQEGSTHTLLMGLQMLKPGEVAWAHRHTFSAIRFAVEGGPGLATVTDGEVCTMEDYDLVLTPRWCWHDHQNSTQDHVTWFDALDIGLINLLNVNVYEPYGDERQPQRQSPADYVSHRTGLLRPVWEERPQLRLPMRYPWRDAEAKLMEMAGAGGSPYDGVVLEYVNPMTGGSTLQTITCWLQRLAPGQETKAHRHSSSSANFVVRGQGRAIVDDTELSWSRHDAFAIPNWTWHHFINDSRDDDAVIFSVNDIPALQALGLYYEEPECSLHRSPWPIVPGELARQQR